MIDGLMLTHFVDADTFCCAFAQITSLDTSCATYFAVDERHEMQEAAALSILKARTYTRYTYRVNSTTSRIISQPLSITYMSRSSTAAPGRVGGNKNHR